mmetsp:Transcript_9061/g.1308  ORF Transcript_9061/g.1308 Transcript_9061/m.1308 type:complete len:105 (-) Transcript_9061:505-819(-)
MLILIIIMQIITVVGLLLHPLQILNKTKIKNTIKNLNIALVEAYRLKNTNNIQISLENLIIITINNNPLLIKADTPILTTNLGAIKKNSPLEIKVSDKKNNNQT